MYIHDPVYQISSPGSHLDDIPSWEGRLKKMGGANTAYWPNYPIRLPKEVKCYHINISLNYFMVILECIKVTKYIPSDFNKRSLALMGYCNQVDSFHRVKSLVKWKFTTLKMGWVLGILHPEVQAIGHIIGLFGKMLMVMV